MPARTNDYQQLVALIEKALAPKGAVITESAMVRSKGTSDLREVDVLIEGSYGPYQLKIAVEVKGEGRKLTLPTFESYVGKYRGDCRVAVDKFILVSRSGFAETVIKAAKLADVELLTIAEAKKKKWESVGSPNFEFRAMPLLRRVFLTPPIPGASEIDVARQGTMICSHGHNHKSPLVYGRCLFFHQWLPKNADEYRRIEQTVSEQHDGRGLVTAKVPMEGWQVAYLGHTYKIDTIAVQVEILYQKSQATHTEIERSSTSGEKQILHHIQSVAAGKQFTIVVPAGEPRPKQIILNIADAKPTSAGGKRPSRRSPKKK